MKRKPIKIDWDELESAFDNRREDLIYYLDLVTGQVVLEGEGEDLHDNADDPEEGIEEPNPHQNRSTRLYIEPPGPEEEVSWMADFVAETRDASSEALGRLAEALDEPDAVDAFRDVLRQHAAERDRWFLYRSERLHDAIDAWLDTNKVHSTEPPPWRG